MKWPLWAAAVVTLTLLGFWLFPGHTFLQADTQIYLPILDRLADPSLFPTDIVALRPHLAFTIYDETALALHRTGLSFENILTAEQLLFRALSIVGLILIALRLGLTEVESVFAASVVSLGASVLGPAILTVELEPIPRAFALGLILFAIGLVCAEHPFAAGLAGSLAFLYQPPATLPFWVIVAFLVVTKRLRWKILMPLAAAGIVFTILAHGSEQASIFRRLVPTQESTERFRASYSFVSTWTAMQRLDLILQTILTFAALRRIKATQAFLLGLPILALLSIPFSWLLLEKAHWSLIPEWQPARAIVFLSILAALLSVTAGMKATGNVERFLWLAAAFLIPVHHLISAKLILIALALAAAATLLRKNALILAAILPFFVIPRTRLNPDTPHLRQLADWARTSTPKSALFFFPEAGTSIEPGLFRGLAERGLYVDWKSGGQVNYFPDFARVWMARWRNPDLTEVDYIVLKNQHLNETPVFNNETYTVYPPRAFSH
jgi:hypothetical protein